MKVPGKSNCHYYLVLVVFSLAIFSRDLVVYIPGYSEWANSLPELIRWTLQPVRWLIIVISGLYIAGYKIPCQWIEELGLNKPAGKVFVVAVVGVSPMLLGPMLMGLEFSSFQPWRWLFFAAIWPLTEEILYRAYAFGQIYRHTKLGFWLAALMTSAVFGLIHLAQASVQGLDLSGQVLTVLIISLGGLLYAWLYVRWSMNLWMPVAVHGLMNLSWQIYDLSATPLGGVEANGLRLAAVVALIGLTFYFTPAISSSDKNNTKLK